MAEILSGAPVAAALCERLQTRITVLKKQGVFPTLAILRVGERADDLSYERSAMKRCQQVGIEVRNVVLPADTRRESFFHTIEKLNEEPRIHGILMFRPLPPKLDGEAARQQLSPLKDVDGCTNGSLAGVFTNTPLGFPPCTAQAAMEILNYYGIDPSGKKAVVIGRSLVIGRPVAMLLMHANATVTICHTRTPDVASVSREADLLICASGQMESIDHRYLRENQIVIDVGIGWNEKKQKLCGDVDFEEARSLVRAITPVPGGVGSVTTAVLCRHVVEAADKGQVRL